MVLLRLNTDKRLQLIGVSKIFAGENKFEQFKILVSNLVCDTDISKCKLYLFVVNEQDEYIKYPIELSKSSDGFCYVCEMDITQDITAIAQTLKLYIKITKDDEVIGYSDYVPLTIHETICGGEEIVPREELLKQINELEAKIIQTNSQLAEMLISKGVEASADEATTQLVNKFNQFDTVYYTDEGRCYAENVVIPDGVTKIGTYAFYGCTRLKKVTIPNSVTDIENSAFYGCANIGKIVLPQHLKTVGNYTFNGAKIYGELVIPASIEKWNSTPGYIERLILSEGITVDTPLSGSATNYGGCTIGYLFVPASNTVLSGGFSLGGLKGIYNSTRTNIFKTEKGFNNKNINFTNFYMQKETIVELLNNLKDLTGEESKTLVLGSTNLSEISEEEIAIATDKNWTLA